MTTPTMSTFPSLRAHMGDWHYYTTLMTFSDVARWVTRTDQFYDNARLRDWIQRKLQTERIAQIAGYIQRQPQHFFNAIVVGIYDGEPEWFPLSVNDSPVAGTPQLAEGSRGSLGLLRLSGAEKVFAIDGQHRVEGVKEAVARDPSCGSEMQAVLFVAHSPTDAGRERTRRLFSTLNRQAKPVSKGEIVALDEDDAFAVVTRKLVESFIPLTAHRVEFRQQTPIAKTNVEAITTILGLYDIVQLVSGYAGGTAKEVRQFMAMRPSDDVVEEIFREQVEFWSAVAKHVPSVGTALASSEGARACEAFRHGRGGHILFRPVGQKAFAKATRVLVNRGSSIKAAVQRLSSVPMELGGVPWRDILWDPTSNVMITKHSTLASNVFLASIGEDPESVDTPAKYLQLTGERLSAQATARSTPTRASRPRRGGP